LRGRIDSNLNAKHKASTLAMRETFKGLIADKEVPSEKREQRKHREEE
jgi:hypothetical protein